MDLNTVMEQAKLCESHSKKLLDLIEEYFNLYSIFRTNHTKVIDNFKEDYITFLKEKGFSITKASKHNNYHVDHSVIKATFAEGALVFELKMYREMDRESKLKTYLTVKKPNNDEVFIYIDVVPSDYTIDINNNDIVPIKYEKGLKEVKNYITNSRYTTEEMDHLYKAIEIEKNNLNKDIKLLEDYYFTARYDEKTFKFKTVEELIKEI